MTAALDRLVDLPPPPPGRTGWPWTEAPQPVPPTAPGGRPWPKISIVTPNYNHAEYLEAAIRSVLLQGYPQLEYVIFDGGSSDGSVEVIRKYAPWLAHWESQRDRGQSHAINKGFARCTGDVVNWLCSDDLLLPGALATVGAAFAESPATDVVLGHTRHRCADDPAQDHLQRASLARLALLPCNHVCQPSCFYRRRLLDRVPPLDESLVYAMDFELWMRFCSRKAVGRVVDVALSSIVWTGSNKCVVGGEALVNEVCRAYERYSTEWVPLTWWYRRFRQPLEKAWMGSKGTAWEKLRYLLLVPELLYVLLLGPFYGFQRVTWFQWRPLYAREPARGIPCRP